LAIEVCGSMTRLVLIVIAVLAGVELGGVAGIFLSIPVVAALSVAWRHGLVWLDEGHRAVKL
jgi:predicted PurR-regulated permease PerM